METTIVQAVIYLLVIIGAALKVYTKIQQTGGNYFNKAHLFSLVVVLMAILAITTQVVNGLNIAFDASAISLSVFIAVVLAGWGAGDLAYNIALSMISEVQATNTTSPTSTTSPLPPATSATAVQSQGLTTQK